MRIAVIQASTQAEKNALLYQITKEVAEKQGHSVFNFGVYPEDRENYSYTEIAFLIALLVNSKAVDFVITGCSSGQGMNLACNALPGLLSGFVQTPEDAFLFARINGGNVASLSLGLGFGWLGELNLRYVLEKLFEGEFGIGYPPEVAERKCKETQRVKDFKALSSKSMREVLQSIELAFLAKILQKQDVIDFILKNAKERGVGDLLAKC